MNPVEILSWKTIFYSFLSSLSRIFLATNARCSIDMQLCIDPAIIDGTDVRPLHKLRSHADLTSTHLSQTANIRFVLDDEAMELRRKAGAVDLRGKVDKEVLLSALPPFRPLRAHAPSRRGPCIAPVSSRWPATGAPTRAVSPCARLNSRAPRARRQVRPQAQQPGRLVGGCDLSPRARRRGGHARRMPREPGSAADAAPASGPEGRQRAGPWAAGDTGGGGVWEQEKACMCMGDWGRGRERKVRGAWVDRAKEAGEAQFHPCSTPRVSK